MIVGHPRSVECSWRDWLTLPPVPAFVQALPDVPNVGLREDPLIHDRETSRKFGTYRAPRKLRDSLRDTGSRSRRPRAAQHSSIAMSATNRKGLAAKLHKRGKRTFSGAIVH